MVHRPGAQIVAEYLRAGSSRSAEFVSELEMRGIIDDHLHSRDTEQWAALLTLEIWSSTYLPRAMDSAPAVRNREERRFADQAMVRQP